MDSSDLARGYIYLAKVYQSLNEDMLKDVQFPDICWKYTCLEVVYCIFVFPLSHLYDFRPVTEPLWI